MDSLSFKRNKHVRVIINMLSLPRPSLTTSTPLFHLLATSPPALSVPLHRLSARSGHAASRTKSCLKSGAKPPDPLWNRSQSEPGFRSRRRRHERSVPPGGQWRLPGRAEGGHTEGAERTGRRWDDTDLMGCLPRQPGGAPAHRGERVSLKTRDLKGQNPSIHPSYHKVIS